MLRKRAGLCVALILLVIFSYVIPGDAASKYAAKVNGASIRNISLDAAVNNFIENQKMIGIRVKEADKDRLRREILEELISAELLYQESKRADLGDLSKGIETQFDNIKNGFPSEKEFKDVLKERGITEKDLKEDIKKGMHIKTFLDRDLYAGISVSQEEKRQQYEIDKDRLSVPERVRVSHILIRVAQDAGSEDQKIAKDKIDALGKDALSGKDFAELARENSEDGSAPNGGDLGYFGRGAMVKPFEDAAFGMEEGEISDVVQTQFGYHILKLTDKQAARALSYEEVERDIENFLLNQRKGERLEKFVNELRSGAKIEIY